MEEESIKKGCGKMALAAGIGLLGLALVAAVIFFLSMAMDSRAPLQRNAHASLRTMITAQADFMANDRDGNGVADFWTADVSGLHDFNPTGTPNGEIKLIEPSLTYCDAAAKGKRQVFPRAGYWFSTVALDETGAPYDGGTGRHPSKFAFCAWPDVYGDGRWPNREILRTMMTFIVNQDGIIWKKDLAGKPVTQWPKDPAAEGWERLN